MRSSALVLSLVFACNGKGSDSAGGSGGDDSGGTTDDSGTTSGVDADKDGYGSADDCNDGDASIHPGATESCDGVDNDCAGGVDDGVMTLFYPDVDGDSYGAGLVYESCTAPGGYVDNDDDCDDTNALVNPAADELCDGIDNNCVDGIEDEDGDSLTWYPDSDGDGHAGEAGSVADCDAPGTDWSLTWDDCDDSDVTVFPGADELCDDVDNDCDSLVDDDDVVAEGLTYWEDGDGDGYGDPLVSTTACDAPAGYVDNDDDCDDTYMYATIDEYKYFDQDQDGYGSGTSFLTCYISPYYVYVGGDCDDYDVAIHPAATEVCDEEDNDCDGSVDGADASIVYTTWYTDTDEDGYGLDSTAVDTCTPASGSVTVGGDCDDGEYLVSPGRDEYCDGLDNDCDGGVDETTDYVDWYRDDDGDHYGLDGDVINDCTQPAGYDLNAGDCDDTSDLVSPAAEEVCGDDVDNDCDTTADNCQYDLDDAAFTFSGNTGSNYIGYSIASGDVNGDGTDDLLVGSPLGASFLGAVYVVKGGASGDITPTGVDETLTGAGEYMGGSVTAQDVDGDGYDDVLTGASWTDRAFLFMGPISSTTTASADMSITAATTGTSFGNAVALGDIDGDSQLDMAITAPYDTPSYYGTAYIFHAPLTGALSSSDADLVVTGATMSSFAGEIENVGDLDGDGTLDLALGAFFAGASYQGEVYLLDPGSTTGTVTASTVASATLTGEVGGDYFGYKIAGGDYNNDGRDDLFATAMYADDGITWSTGRVYGWFGPLSGTYAGTSADVILNGDIYNGYMGTDVALGDFDKDGGDDVVVGAQNMDGYVGKAFVLRGPDTGSLDMTSTVTFGDVDDASVYNYLGATVASIGDWSGDGADEVVLGGWGFPSGSYTYAGRTWVVFSDDL